MKRVYGKNLIEQKVESFHNRYDYYTSKDFQEEENRSAFIEPFFTALGWNFNQTNLAYHLWDVHREERQKRKGGNTKKPDYAFRINGKLSFYIEAKAPWVPLTDKNPVFQAKGYAFSTNGKAPIVILTDFEEFKVYNALERPVYNNTLQGLIKDLDIYYTNYVDKWDFIYDFFSREAVADGSLNKLVGKITKNTKTLDKEFLEDLINWREQLARHIAVRNLNLSDDQINEGVQRILDRLIFIRNLEDREVEDTMLLDIINRKENIYKELLSVFDSLNDDYNGLLFKKHFSEKIIIDDNVIKKIIKNLYPPYSPYQFDVIEPEILGRIYEKFLGSKIRLTKKHQAKVEEKPEVRHAGGVYYTPQYIVDSIVKETVGKLIKGKKPEQIKEIKILDPACGSGSFLIGAFTYLIECHRDFYSKNQNIKKYKEDYYLTAEGEIKLSIKKKGDILINNIFGVDIDREATEVAIMSLYLKLLEYGFDAEYKKQATLFMKGFILPDLTKNILCGNSLISREQLFTHDMFGDEDIQPFDWNNDKEGFGKIFKEKGGFDCVIGNPPYIKTQEMQKYQPKTVELYKKLYKAASKGNFDIYIVFIEKALALLNENGLLGYICSHKFFNSGYGEKIRRIISENKNIYKILNFGINQIFENATTYTCLFFLANKELKQFQYYEYEDIKDDIEKDLNQDQIKYYEVNSDLVTSNDWIFTNKENEEYMNKLKINNPFLEDITTNIFQGPKAGADPVFILSFKQQIGSDRMLLFSKNLNKEVILERGLLKPYIKGKFIKRYKIEATNEFIIYPYDENGLLVKLKKIKAKFPCIYNYLNTKENKEVLLERENGRFKDIWWSFSRPQNMKIINKEKLLTPFNAFNASFSFDNKCDFIFSAGVSGAYGILLAKEIKISYYYLLGLLNSSTIDKYLKIISTALRGGFYSYENKYIKQLPIYLPDSSDPKKYVFCQKIEEMVNKILELKKDPKKNMDADFLEKKIDEYVEEIYLK